ncbi:MAG: hypothetical protein WD078_03390 [Woeseia sp.]
MRRNDRIQRVSGAAAASLVLAAGLVAIAGAASITVVDQSGEPLQHAVVTAIRAGDTARPAPVNDRTIAQLNQQFLPRVTVLPSGARVAFPNRDTTQHHVYSFSKPKPFEIELYKGDNPEPVVFDTPGIVALGCNIHDWMLGYVYVTTDEYFAVSAADGTLELDVSLHELGNLTVWHPAATELAPRTIAAASLASDAGGPLILVVPTRADDPLAFEIDPLQLLFGEGAQ